MTAIPSSKRTVEDRISAVATKFDQTTGAALTLEQRRRLALPRNTVGLRLPRVEHRDSRLIEIAPVASHHRKPVLQGCGRKHEVRV